MLHQTLRLHLRILRLWTEFVFFCVWYLIAQGEDLQNIPLWPLLQRERNLDFIFAVDSSADNIYNWPNGTSLVATYQKFLLDNTNDVVFPSVPDQQTYSRFALSLTCSFVNLGLNARPTFFGCNASNFTSYNRPPPLVLYFPHVGWTSYNNYSTFMLEYSDTQVQNYITNGIAEAVRSFTSWSNLQSQGNSTTWPICLACAVLQRAKERAGIPIGSQCQQCFDQYCWSGAINTTANTYNPSLLAATTGGSANSSSTSDAITSHISGAWAALTLALSVLLLWDVSIYHVYI